MCEKRRKKEPIWYSWTFFILTLTLTYSFVCCSMLQCVGVCCIVLLGVAVCCCVLLCVAVSCSVTAVAVWCSMCFSWWLITPLIHTPLSYTHSTHTYTPLIHTPLRFFAPLPPHTRTHTNTHTQTHTYKHTHTLTHTHIHTQSHTHTHTPTHTHTHTHTRTHAGMSIIQCPCPHGSIEALQNVQFF